MFFAVSRTAPNEVLLINMLPRRGSDPDEKENGFVKLMETRPEGFKHLSLDGSPGVVEALTAAGVRTRTTDPQHCDLHKDTITGCREQLFQLNPVGMGVQAFLSLTTQSHLSPISPDLTVLLLSALCVRYRTPGTVDEVGFAMPPKI